MELTRLQREAVEGLRSFADFLEHNPDFIVDRETLFMVFAFRKSNEEFYEMAKRMGPVTKSGDDKYFNVERTFGPMVKLHLTISRERVCEKVVTVKEVEVTEWKCLPILEMAEQENK